MAVDITLSSPTLPSPTLPPIDEADETMINLVSEFGALPPRRPRAPRTRRVLYPLSPFEIARDPIDQLAVSKHHTKRNIKTPSCGTH